MARLSLTLKETDAQIFAQINKRIADKLSSAIKSAAPAILSEIKDIVREAITSSPEYRELFGGSLQAELGVPNAGARIDRILDMWLESIEIEIQRPRPSIRGVTGGLSVVGIRDGYADVLGTSDATYVTEKGRTIPWLQWLLIEGDRDIIADYTFSSNISSGQRSRTGLGVMKQDRSKRWRVPPQFSGTSNNNFVTRSLNSVAIQIEKAIQFHIERFFGGS
ncbi:MAG: hypothetical protein VW438_06905 [Euryarchaeota archaeon]